MTIMRLGGFKLQAMYVKMFGCRMMLIISASRLNRNSEVAVSSFVIFFTATKSPFHDAKNTSPKPPTPNRFTIVIELKGGGATQALNANDSVLRCVIFRACSTVAASTFIHFFIRVF